MKLSKSDMASSVTLLIYFIHKINPASGKIMDNLIWSQALGKLILFGCMLCFVF